MNRLKSLHLLFLFLSLLSVYSCFDEYKIDKSKGIVKKKAIDYGTFSNGTYTNSFFDLTISIPESWYVMDDESRIKLMQKGSKVVAGDNKNLNAVMEAADLQNVSFLISSEHEIGSPVESNPSIMILAENVAHAPGVKRGKDYHFHSKKLLQSSAMSVTFPKEVYEEKVNGTPFDVMEMSMNIGGITSIQKQYVYVAKRYALIIILSYQNEKGRQKLESILKTMKVGV